MVFLSSGKRVVVKCGGGGSVYADGSKMFSCSSATTKNIIPQATRLVTVFGQKTAKDGTYIAADLLNGFRTSATAKWKCTNQLYTGWTTAEYDDSDWNDAVSHGPISNGDLEDVTKIWTSDRDNDNAYCRGHVGKCRVFVHCQTTPTYKIMFCITLSFSITGQLIINSDTPTLGCSNHGNCDTMRNVNYFRMWM